jgi:hypothetical protein
MAFLLVLLLSWTAHAQPVDCPSVPVGPPMDVQIYADLSSRAKLPLPGPVFGGVSLSGLPAYGTLCRAPPPPAGDALRGAAAPHDILRGDGPADVLRGPAEGNVVVGPGYPVPSSPDAARPQVPQQVVDKDAHLRGDQPVAGIDRIDAARR